ncbi:MAG: phosphoserine phosphatase [Thermoplasmata archaeon]|nr:phosphoserine phosphatase [Thermoplasmata archaeon]
MTEYLEELEEKRNQLNVEAENHRKKRDRLNQETKQHADQRDVLNAKVKKLLQEANKFKDKRDSLNGKVREEKAHRDTLTHAYNDLKSELDKLKRNRISSSDEQSLYRAKKELQGMEFKQMTTPLDAGKERGLIEKMSRIKKQIEEKEKEMEGNEDFRELLSQVRDAKREMDDSHHQVNEYADLAQKEHDQMIDCFSQSDKIRKEADSCQERFVASKVKADEEHNQHIDLIHLVHDYDKILFALRQNRRTKDRKPKGPGAPAPAAQTGKMEAERIYERFKKGDKISTEDLMLLQKHGFL